VVGVDLDETLAPDAQGKHSAPPPLYSVCVSMSAVVGELLAEDPYVRKAGSGARSAS
jgi:hypothetical protein